MQCPLIRPELSQTVQREIDEIPNADSGGAGEQERIGTQVIGSAEFVAEELIVLRRKRSGQIVGLWREVLAANEVRLNGMAIGGQIVQQTAKAKQVVSAGFIT